jgi:hypothetical protein
MTSQINGPIQYLVCQILNRRCVPLVGAGISRYSTKLGKKWDGHLIWRLIERVIEPTFVARMSRLRASGARFHSCKKCHGHFRDWEPYKAEAVGLSQPASSNCILCDLRLAKQQDSLTKACESFLWEKAGSTGSAFAELTSTLEIPASAKRSMAIDVKELRIRTEAKPCHLRSDTYQEQQTTPDCRQVQGRQ